MRGDDVIFHKEEGESGGLLLQRVPLYVLCAKFFADVIKANGVTISNRVDKPNSPVIFEAEATIFRNSPLVRKAIEELAEEDGLPEPFSERLEIRRNRSSQSDRIEG